MDKLPPKEKILEAYSAIADERITMHEDEHCAEIISSDHAKTYTVTWEETMYRSDDNATFWAGYPGYPVLAVWMKQGILPVNETMVSEFKNVNWNALNKQYRRNYAKAASALISERGLKEDKIRNDIDQVYEAITQLPYSVGRLTRKRSSK